MPLPDSGLLPSRHVLVIDDDRSYRSCLCRAMNNRGWRAMEADGGSAALGLLHHQSPELILVDLRMDGMTGLEAIPELRQLAPEACIIMLTGYGSIATAVEATKRGADHYLTKPVDADQIESAYHRAVNGDDPAESERPQVPSLDRVEWEHLQRVLLDRGGNISEAARVLGMHRRSLQRKLARPAPTR